uniref:Uncharacterized protein n=1 Tax=Brugia malayi TaxID=6279 RepID=A8PTH8_BRUMA
MAAEKTKDSTDGIRRMTRYLHTYGCTPFDYDAITQNVALRSHYAHGENTFKSQLITISK